ncbi:response regulator [Pseudodesulfovibrio sp. JC047]|uniref:sigma-54-dependent transcriptional regulator n=1 Tax=Pseudodesulfovibrio sp. JC047 TaxID=2683199 RepID=UPI0013D46A7C|nr:sigma-54 dependent transcriptional regulator [Pseudodesulfovibrio sp. JC047]NDV19069.1 response regulator [Pseudodesulfovibrio sp. JC047]
MKKHLCPSHPILVVDDEKSALQSFEMALFASGYTNVMTCEDSRKVMSMVEKNPLSLVLLDMVMPNISGPTLLKMLKEKYPWLPIIIVSAVSDGKSVIQCMRDGARDYIFKPVDKNELAKRIRSTLEFRDMEQENARLREQILETKLKAPEVFTKILTQDPKMLSIFKYCEAVAGSQNPILITGETGTGKELIAQAIHQLSNRTGEFVAVNVAAFDDPVFADSLFGHVRGAFTGADKARKGLVEQANGGTLFLDEIGDLSLSSQVKLLRLLQEQEYFPVGSDLPKKANVRVVTSTLKNLTALKKSKKFREDLYYRLVGHQVTLPPLRERLGDIPLLLDYFLECEATEQGKTKPAYHPELINFLRTYSFPGNIREFKAMASDAVSQHCSRMLSSASFKKHIINEDLLEQDTPHPEEEQSWESLNFSPEKIPPLKEVVTKISTTLIHTAMERSGGNQSAAARILGISQQALSLKLKKMNA